MPLPFLLLLGIAIGISAAAAAKTELLLSPRPPLLTAAFSAFLTFVLLVLVPVSVYFYVFHGDWFLLYLVDTGAVPSAIALVGFALQAGIATLGFLVGTALVRAQHMVAVYVAIGVALLLAAGVVPAALDRLRVVGSFVQFHGSFGLVDYSDTPLARGGLVMGTFLLAGTAFLLSRLGRAGK